MMISSNQTSLNPFSTSGTEFILTSAILRGQSVNAYAWWRYDRTSLGARTAWETDEALEGGEPCSSNQGNNRRLIDSTKDDGVAYLEHLEKQKQGGLKDLVLAGKTLGRETVEEPQDGSEAKMQKFWRWGQPEWMLACVHGACITRPAYLLTVFCGVGGATVGYDERSNRLAF